MHSPTKCEMSLPFFQTSTVAWPTAVTKLSVRSNGTLVSLGDLNGDGIVNAADLAVLLNSWGSGGPADLDGSGSVDAADMTLLLNAFS